MARHRLAAVKRWLTFLGRLASPTRVLACPQFQFSTGPDPPQNFNKRRPNRARQRFAQNFGWYCTTVVATRLVAAAADWLACAALLRVSGDPDCLGSLHNASCTFTMHTFACLITWSFPELRLVDSITSTNLHGLLANCMAILWGEHQRAC